MKKNGKTNHFQKNNKKKILIKKILLLCLPYWKFIVIVFTIIIVNSYVDAQVPTLYRILTDILTQFSNKIENNSNGNFSLNFQIDQQQLILIYSLSFQIISLLFIISLLNVISESLSYYVGEGISHNLRIQLYNKLQQLDIAYFTKQNNNKKHMHENTMGQFISLFNNDLTGAQTTVSYTIPHLLHNIMMIIFTLYVMLSMNIKLTLLSLFIIPFFHLPTKFISKKLSIIHEELLSTKTKMNSYLNDTISLNGILLIRNFNRQNFVTENFKQYSEKIKNLENKHAFFQSCFSQFLGLFITLSSIFIYFLGGIIFYFLYTYKFFEEDMILKPGLIIAFASYIRKLSSPLSQLSDIQIDLSNSAIYFEKIFDCLDTKNEIYDKGTAVELKKVHGKLRFEDVYFKYQESTKWIFEGITIEILPGEIAVFIGPNGAGKTTISYLLMRLYELNKGSIYIDDYNINDITLKSLHQQIGILSQETYLLNDSILNNLTFAKDNVSQKEIIKACKLANIYGMILSLPQQFQTLVGERGYFLSGGERQKLAIARILIKNPSILILDEFNSHLDKENELLIQQSLHIFLKKKKKTCLIISHHLSTFSFVDKIYLVKDGNIYLQNK